jgi:hypothetical protein
MLKEFADLPSSIDSFIDGLIGFLYRTLLTFGIVVFEPRWGAVRALAAPKRFSKPTTALFVSISLIAITSLLGPQKIPVLLAEDKHEISSWIMYVLLLYLAFDGIILVCGLVSRTKRRFQRRTIAILRYSVAGMLAAWAFLAALHLVLAARFPSAPGAPPVLPTALSWLLTALTVISILPLCGGIAIVSCANKPSIWRRLLNLTIFGALLGGLTFFVDRHSVPLLYSAVRAAFPLTHGSEPHVAAPAESYAETGPYLSAGPLVCRLRGSGEIRVTAALTNRSDMPVALDAAQFTLSIARLDSNILHPDFLEVSLHSVEKRILTLSPRAATVVEFSGSVPRTAISSLDNKCLLEYRGAQRKLTVISDVGVVEDLAAR